MLWPGRQVTFGRDSDVGKRLFVEVLIWEFRSGAPYDAESLVKSLERSSTAVVLRPKSIRKVQRDCDYALYAVRDLVERFFNHIKHF